MAEWLACMPVSSATMQKLSESLELCHIMSNLLQLPLLRDRWKLILFGACFQYVHGISTQLAHRMHQPMNQPLHDIGFSLLPVSHLCSTNLY